MTISVSSTLLSQQLAARSAALRAAANDAALEVATGRASDIAKAAGSDFGLLTARKADAAQTEAYRANAEGFVRRADVKQLALSDILSAAESLLVLASEQLPTANATQLGGPPVAPGDPAAANPLYNPANFAETARTVLERVIAAFNTADSAGFMFAGVASDTQPLSDANAPGPSGLTPQQAIDAQAALFPPTTPLGVTDFITAIDDVFSNAALPANPAEDFTGAFYAGAPATGPRIAVTIAEGVSIDYGLQGDDPAARQLLQGLHMLASVDLTAIDPASLDEYADAARTALASGLDGLRESQAGLGAAQAQAQAAADTHAARLVLINEEIAGVAEIDPIESQVRYQALETQLSFLYEVIGRVSRLSLMDFVR